MDGRKRIIAHLDMDAFFAQVEERNNPQFAGLPIVVGADPKNGFGRGVVSTANYQARSYGIHSAQPISTAWRLSQQAKIQGKPEVVFLPPNFSQYQKVADEILVILQRHISFIEQASIDEYYLDLSFICHAELDLASCFEKANALMEKIKSEIKLQERLTASVGIGPNKLIAKLLSSRFKPDGLAVITQKEINTFLDPLPTRDIPGIGPKTEEFLLKQHIRTVADLKKISKEELIGWFGKWGSEMYDRIRGIDDSLVEIDREIKSISEEETFEVDTLNPSYLFERLLFLTTSICPRLRNEKITGFKTISVKIRFSDFTTKIRSHTLDSYTDNRTVLQTEVKRLFLPFLDKRENPQKKAIRLVGVKVDNWQKSVL